jgi:DNA-binding transcriptional LysR family regulator
MDIRGLNIFIEAAELGSFTRTGEKLGYSQPTVSFQIKQLEKEMGAQLFDRIGHTVSLTDAGRDALTYAQQICMMTQEMALGTDKRREPTGVIRLGMADSLYTPLVVREFARFRETYPKVALHITTGGTGDLFRLLDHNEVDMICSMDTQVFDTNYVIADEERVGVHIIASANNPLAKRKRLALQEVLDYPFMLTEKGMSYRRLLDEQLAQQEMEIQPVLEMGGADLICRLVEQDMGLSLLPDYVTESAVRSGSVVRLDVPELRVDVWKQLVYRRDKWVSLPMQAMIRHLSAIRLTK